MNLQIFGSALVTPVTTGGKVEMWHVLVAVAVVGFALGALLL